MCIYKHQIYIYHRSAWQLKVTQKIFLHFCRPKGQNTCPWADALVLTGLCTSQAAGGPSFSGLSPPAHCRSCQLCL